MTACRVSDILSPPTGIYSSKNTPTGIGFWLAAVWYKSRNPWLLAIQIFGIRSDQRSGHSKMCLWIGWVHCRLPNFMFSSSGGSCSQCYKYPGCCQWRRAYSTTLNRNNMERPVKKRRVSLRHSRHFWAKNWIPPQLASTMQRSYVRIFGDPCENPLLPRKKVWQNYFCFYFLGTECGNLRSGKV